MRSDLAIMKGPIQKDFFLVLTLALSEARSGYIVKIGTGRRQVSVRLANEALAVGSSLKAAHGEGDCKKTHRMCSSGSVIGVTGP